MGQKKAQSIGIFDSGIGGFSILKKIHELAPDLAVHYIADAHFAPYGNKSNQEIIERSRFICSKLIEKNIDLIVVACNTATGIAIDSLREEFDISFVGVEPFINSLTKNDWEPDDNGCVITTELMSKSERFQKLKLRLDPKEKLSYRSTPKLASIIEEFFTKKNETLLLENLEEELRFVKESQFTHLILGCTHYPLISKYIENVTQAKVLSPCTFVANRVLDLLNRDSRESGQKLTAFEYAVTGGDDILRFVSKDFSNLP